MMMLSSLSISLLVKTQSQIPQTIDLNQFKIKITKFLNDFLKKL